MLETNVAVSPEAVWLALNHVGSTAWIAMHRCAGLSATIILPI